MSQIGNNSAPQTSAEMLRGFISRIVLLEDGRRELAADIKAVKDEAKAAGFDVRVINRVLQRMKFDSHEVDAMDQLVALYEQHLRGAE